jgi:serine/threonine-protein kinase RsbW
MPQSIAKLDPSAESPAAVRLAVGAGTAARAIACARRFAEAAALPEVSADRLAIVVEEWVNNVVEHGRPPAGSFLVLRLEQVAGQVRAHFSDAGVAFDPRGARAARPNLRRGGGAGLAFIAAWCQVEAYRRRRGRNRLVLRLRS